MRLVVEQEAESSSAIVMHSTAGIGLPGSRSFIFRSFLCVFNSCGIFFSVVAGNRVSEASDPAEEVAQGVDLASEHESDAGLCYLAFEYAFVAGVSEQSHIHGAAFVEHVLERDVVNEIFGEILVGVCIGGVVAAYNNLEAVVEQGL